MKCIEDIFDRITEERDYQDKKWGNDFDRKNTLNDWVTYINLYASAAAMMDEEDPRGKLLKAAALCVAALQQESWADRHYDNNT